MVHTIYVKRVSHPFSPRPDELWIMAELNSEGLETWRSLESFLGILYVSNDPLVLRAVANQWRLHYEVAPITQTDISPHMDPVLPHPEHSNITFGQPVSVIPDHTSILQACWGRSAHQHSQGEPISLSWPPTRQTPPTSPTRSTLWTPTLHPSPAIPSSPTPLLPQLRSAVGSNVLICHTPVSNRPKSYLDQNLCCVHHSITWFSPR